MSNPVVVWGTSEGSSTNVLQSTSGMISSLDTHIYPVVAAYELGLDFLSDTAVTLGQILITELGNSMQEELDKVIASGNGSTQPTGLDAATGATSVSSANGTSGPLSVDEIEQIYFGLGKQYRTKGNAPHRCAWVMNDAQFRRIRAIPVSASDAPRIFGMNEGDYTIFGYRRRLARTWRTAPSCSPRWTTTACTFARAGRRGGPRKGRT